MIRFTTDEAIEAKLKRQRIALAAQYAGAIGAMFTEDCDHSNRKSCASCAERRTIQAAVAVVREAGGDKQQRGGERRG